jgi:hypothetical protein
VIPILFRRLMAISRQPCGPSLRNTSLRVPISTSAPLLLKRFEVTHVSGNSRRSLLTKPDFVPNRGVNEDTL